MNAEPLLDRFWNRWRAIRLARKLAGLVLLGALAVGGVAAMRLLRPDSPDALLPGQMLAWQIARAASQTDGVQVMSGAYLPGDRMILYTRTTQTDRARVRSWALVQLEPFADQLGRLPSKETLTWLIDFGPAPAEQEAITVPLRRAADATAYRYVSAAPALFGETDSQTAAAPAEAPAAPVAQAPVAPTVEAPVAPAVQVPVQPGAPGVLVVVATPVPNAVPVVAATALPAPTTVLTATDGAALLATNFDDAAAVPAGWLPLSGNWRAEAGVYSQLDTGGYDFISFADQQPQTNYVMEARLRLGEGDMGGGFVYNAPDPRSRANAQNVDFDNKGGFIRWGRYDASGGYLYIGGTRLDTPINDGQWHSLRLVTQGGVSVVSLDGREMGRIGNQSTSGYYGLLASKTRVDFDDVRVAPFAGNGAVTAAPQVTPPPASDFRDDFTDGDAEGWQVLSGSWQMADGVYRQTDMNGSDLGSVTPFQSDSYSVTVRLRRLDGEMGAGLYFNMAQRESKSRSQMINYIEAGKAIQWGHFDDGGNFVFEGSAPVPDSGDGAWHVLNVRVQDGLARFAVDGAEIARDVTLAYPSGYVGLLVSRSSVDFDDLRVAAE